MRRFYVGLKILFGIIFLQEPGLKSLAGERISKFFIEKKIFYSDVFSI